MLFTLFLFLSAPVIMFFIDSIVSYGEENIILNLNFKCYFNINFFNYKIFKLLNLTTIKLKFKNIELFIIQ